MADITERLLELARIFAAAQALRDDAPNYLKGNPHTFQPHDWVLEAMRSAAEEATTDERYTLALEIASECAACDIECYCIEVSDDDAGNGRWYDIDRLAPDGEWERHNIARAERFLELAGRLERRADNPRIVRIKDKGAKE